MGEESIHPLVRFAVERRVTMGMLLLACLVLGGLSLQRLPLEFLPPISSSNISLQAPYPSSSPEEITRLIIRPLEDSLGTLNGLDRLSSSASENEASINATFVDGTDMNLAAVEVRDRVDRVRHLLPDDLRQVRIRRFQSSDLPVVRSHLSFDPEATDWNEDRLYEFAERVVQRRLERLEGVAQVSIRGSRTREVQVRLDADLLGAHGLDARDLARTLRQSHLRLSAGEIVESSRKLRVRIDGELRSLEDIRSLPIGGKGLEVRDVAEVAFDFPRQETFNYLNGREALSLRIYKASDANLLQVVELAKAELAKIASEPAYAGVTYRVYRDSSVDVSKGLAQLRDAGLLGGGLAILAVFLFLRRARTTLLIGIAIPVSVVFTFVLMFFLRQSGQMDLTLNVVSLMGLVLALGMLVDNSIVVIESIYRRIEQLGEDSTTAALRGASEVAMPILASTATTLCVFFPLIFLRSGGGFFSTYLREVGTTVCIVMVASLLVALTVVPAAAALLLGEETPRRIRWIETLGRRYGALLVFTLRYRLLFLLFAAGLLYASLQLFLGIERSFGEGGEERQITVHVDTPNSFSLEQVKDLFADIYGILDTNRDDLDIADVTTTFQRTGGRSRGRDSERSLELYLREEEESRHSTTEVRDRLRELMPELPGVQFRIGQSQRRHSSGGLEVELSGDDPAVLEILGREIAGQIAAIPGLSDVDLSLESGDDEMRVAVDRERAVLAGLSTQDVAQTVQSALSDRALGTLMSDDREVDLVMQYREDQRETLAQLQSLQIGARSDGRTLGSMAEFATVAGPRSIEREDRRSKLRITCNTESPVAARKAMFGVMGLMQGQSMPAGYSWSFGRWDRMRQQDEQGSGFALLFALVLVYMLMASLFESLLHPLSIMISVPFAFIGVGVVMKLAGQARDNFTEMGFIILVGVVVNNAIVLIDHINRLRREGLRRSEAIVLGGQHRVRAILMTAVTTILGLLPMVAPLLLPGVFGSPEGRAATWAPVGLVILGGLTTSTFLTLLVVPTVYSMIDDVGRLFVRIARRV